MHQTFETVLIATTINWKFEKNSNLMLIVSELKLRLEFHNWHIYQDYIH